MPKRSARRKRLSSSTSSPFSRASHEKSMKPATVVKVSMRTRKRRNREKRLLQREKTSGIGEKEQNNEKGNELNGKEKEWEGERKNEKRERKRRRKRKMRT